LCAHPASITLVEKLDPRRGSEAHAIVLHCPNSDAHRPLSELELLRIWAAQHARRTEPGVKPSSALRRSRVHVARSS
jgi:hypothetical protein